MINLKNKNALITGAGKGIGKAIADLYCQFPGCYGIAKFKIIAGVL